MRASAVSPLWWEWLEIEDAKDELQHFLSLYPVLQPPLDLDGDSFPPHTHTLFWRCLIDHSFFRPLVTQPITALMVRWTFSAP